MVTNILHSPAETERLGECWGQNAAKGWIVGLSGPLGAGKTCLVKGLARGLGATDRVHSPTFALLNEYRTGHLPLYHLDLYRLETPGAVIQAGLVEYMQNPAGVTVIEWIEHWMPCLKKHLTKCTDTVDLVQIRDQWPEFKAGMILRWARLEEQDDETRQVFYDDFSG